MLPPDLVGENGRGTEWDELKTLGSENVSQVSGDCGDNAIMSPNQIEAFKSLRRLKEEPSVRTCVSAGRYL